MIRPTPEQLGSLSRFEKLAFRLCDEVNRRPALKEAQHTFLRTAGASWVDACMGPRLRILGMENIPDHLDQGVLLVSNHRTFFDLYVISCVLLRNSSFIKGMYFPVRSDFFYDSATGILVNSLMAGLSMYPPVFREKEKRAFNHYTVDALIDALATPGTLVGMHPEGTRNKTDDPYTLLPAKPGVGEMVFRARPLVLPVYLLGMGNDFVHETTSTFTRTGGPVTMVIGKPTTVPIAVDATAGLKTYKRIADHLCNVLTELGEKERQYRAREGFPNLAPPTSIDARSSKPSKRSAAA